MEQSRSSTSEFDWEAVAAEARERLAGLPVDVDLARVRAFAREIARGGLGPDANCFPDDPDPVGPEAVEVLEALPASERAELRRRGERALAAGEVAVVVLNGGMATRFGGVVKGVVDAIGGRSFLAIKRAQARARGPLPFVLMNSFATHAATLEHLRELGLEGEVESFLQGVSLRLSPRGEPFRDARGELSLYAPGHGDFPESIRGSGTLARLRAGGVRTILLSNVDNLGAEPDAELVGYHLARGRPVTCELAEVEPGDAGGTPARVGDQIMIVEGFRFSPAFDFSRLHYLATNTYLFSADVLDEEHELRWFYVEKQVDGATAIQMERLVNELTARVPTSYLATPRSGARGRFLPIKSPADLERLRADPELVERFGAV